jgi:hypothetical protein
VVSRLDGVNLHSSISCSFTKNFRHWCRTPKVALLLSLPIKHLLENPFLPYNSLDSSDGVAGACRLELQYLRETFYSRSQKASGRTLSEDLSPALTSSNSKKRLSSWWCYTLIRSGVQTFARAWNCFTKWYFRMKSGDFYSRIQVNVEAYTISPSTGPWSHLGYFKQTYGSRTSDVFHEDLTNMVLCEDNNEHKEARTIWVPAGEGQNKGTQIW